MDCGASKAQNSRGLWVPSIPLPLYGLRKRCFRGLPVHLHRPGGHDAAVQPAVPRSPA